MEYTDFNLDYAVCPYAPAFTDFLQNVKKLSKGKRGKHTGNEQLPSCPVGRDLSVVPGDVHLGVDYCPLGSFVSSYYNRDDGKEQTCPLSDQKYQWAKIFKRELDVGRTNSQSGTDDGNDECSKAGLDGDTPNCYQHCCQGTTQECDDTAEPCVRWADHVQCDVDFVQEFEISQSESENEHLARTQTGEQSDQITHDSEVERHRFRSEGQHELLLLDRLSDNADKPTCTGDPLDQATDNRQMTNKGHAMHVLEQAVKEWVIIQTHSESEDEDLAKTGADVIKYKSPQKCPLRERYCCPRKSILKPPSEKECFK